MRPCDDLVREVHLLRVWVAIDGPAGAGKSTVGRSLAECLACNYLDTGLMYRAVTRRARANGVAVEDVASLAVLARSMQFELDGSKLLIDGIAADATLHAPEINAAVSAVSAHPAVRAVLVDRQRQFARQGAIVMVGRDIGTVVLPDAPVKLWVTAPAEVRARRRQVDRSAPDALDAPETAGALLARDRIDSSRQASPLTRAPDAVDIDTDLLTRGEALEAAKAAVRFAVVRLESCPPVESER